MPCLPQDIPRAGPTDGPVASSRRSAIIASTTANVMLVGWLTMRLAHGRLLPGVVAVAFCGVSFSSLLLLGSLPESDSVSSLASVAPLVFLTSRMNQKFNAYEAVGWVLLGVLGIGLTITQISHWVIALGSRIYFATAEEPGTGRARLGAFTTAVCVGTALLTWAGVSLQHQRYPRAQLFYEVDLLASESRWFRFDDVVHRPLSQTARLLGHLAIYDFAAPFPVYSDYLIRLLENRAKTKEPYWSLSLEEATPMDWRIAQLPLLVGLAALFAAAGSGVRKLDRRFVAPGLCVASQIGLHFLYGRVVHLVFSQLARCLGGVTDRVEFSRLGRDAKAGSVGRSLPGRRTAPQ